MVRFRQQEPQHIEQEKRSGTNVESVEIITLPFMYISPQLGLYFGVSTTVCLPSQLDFEFGTNLTTGRYTHGANGYDLATSQPNGSHRESWLTPRPPYFSKSEKSKRENKDETL
jgi:hypothetical protein